MQLANRGTEGFWRRLRWQFGIFTAYFAQFIKMRLAYRMDFLVDTLAVSFSLAIQLAVLTVLFSKVRALDGWSFEEVLFIYGFSLLPLGLFNLISVNFYGFSDKYIIAGKFDRVLLRPVNTLVQVIFESFNISGFNEILLGSLVMIYAGMKLNLAFGVADVVVMVVLVPSAAMVYTGVFLGLTAVSFWHEDRMGLSPPVYNIIRFSRYPLTIYSLPVRVFLTFVLPFAWVAFYPATWFIGGTISRSVALLTIPMGWLVFGGAVWFWQRGVARYSSTGS